MSALFLVGTLGLTFGVASVCASGGTVYIRRDCSVEPPGAPIHHVGDIYTANHHLGISLGGGGSTLSGNVMSGNKGRKVTTYYSRIDQVPVLSWTRATDPVIGTDQTYDQKGAESPCVVKKAPNNYLMFYRGWGNDDIHRIVKATSTDGVTWTRQGVVFSPVNAWEGTKVSPMTVLLEGSTLKMWYEGGGGAGIGYAESTDDGNSWTREASPVLSPGPDKYDNWGVGENHVVKVGKKYVMLYKGYGEQYPGWAYFCYAESGNGKQWTKAGIKLKAILGIGEHEDLRAIRFIKINEEYVAFFSDSTQNELEMASSADFFTWTRHGLVLRKRPANQWDSAWVTSSYQLIEDTTFVIYYEGGGNDGKCRIMRATINKQTIVDQLNIIVKADPQLDLGLIPESLPHNVL